VCFRAPGAIDDPNYSSPTYPNKAAEDRAKVQQLTTSFKSTYNLKQVFAETAVYCMGD
jgi:hypothetical protein